MDPVLAFGLAGTILQFVDSSTRFVAVARKIYRHGSDDAEDHIHLLKITECLDEALPKLTRIENSSETEQSLNQLALDCSKTAKRLLAILQKIKSAGNTRKRDALRTAFRLISNEHEIKSLDDQLSSFRNQMNWHLLLSLR